MRKGLFFLLGVICALFIINISQVNSYIGGIYNRVTQAINHTQSQQKVLSIAMANNVIGLDPSVITDQESLRLCANIYDTLVRYDTTGSNILPGLATAWQVSPDGLTWTFQIRQAVYFHDGTLLDAEVIAFNFERWMDLDNPYHIGNFSYWNMSFGGYPGIVDYVRAVSSHVLEIKLKQPYAPFLNTLAMPAYGIASSKTIKTYNETLRYHPVGTGPFIFDSWSEDDQIILFKNIDYWQGAPAVDELHFKTINDHNARLTALKSGEVQIAHDLPSYLNAAVLNSDQLNLVRRPIFNIGYLAFNLENETLSKPLIRRAIDMAIDRDKMIKTAYNSNARVANTFLPPLLWGYNEGIEIAPVNTELAKILIENNTEDLPLNLTLLVMDSPRTYFPEPVQLALMLRKQLAEIGIELRLDIRPWHEVLDKSKQGEYDMVLSGWNGDIVDPDNFLYNFFSSNNTEKGITSNYSLYKSARVDELLESARATSDSTFRESLYREILEIIAKDKPAIPLAYTMPTIALRNEVQNYYAHINGIEPLNEVDLGDYDD